MKHSFLVNIVIGLLCSGWNLSAQQLPSYAMGMPVELVKPYYSAERHLSGEQEDRYWIVYSDRHNNSTYTSPGGSIRKSFLSFMERLYVAEREGNYLHVYKDPNYSESSDSKLSISNYARSYGWIHMDKLLLWRRSILNEKNYVDRKAMILNTFEGLSLTAIEDSLVEFKLDPELRTQTGKKSRLFEIFHVYKITDRSVLLGIDAQIVGNEIDEKSIIRGWVPLDKVTFWDHRITLEPNWENASSFEREQLGIDPAVFSDVRAALDFQRGRQVLEQYKIWSNDPGNIRNVGEWRRFPVLSYDENNVYKVGAMGKIQDLISSERYAKIMNTVSVLEGKYRHVNVVFVIDGSESMGPYFNVVSKALENSINQLKKSDTQNRFRFGYVIYRDFQEGENLIDIQEVTTNYQKVISELENVRTDFSQDTDLPEALNYGLEKALLSSGLSKEETNYIIMIGDAGNHQRDDDSQVSDQDIIDLLSKTECNLIAFQVHNGYHKTYDDFVYHSQRLVIGAARKIHDQNKSQKDLWRYKEYDEPYFVSNAATKYQLNDQENYGSFLFPAKGGSLEMELLGMEIESSILNFDRKTSRIIQTGYDIMRGMKVDEVSDFDESVIGFLSKIKGLTPSEIEYLKKRNVQFSMDGYTSVYHSKLKDPLFRQVLFLSTTELADVVIKISGLISDRGSYNNRRKEMQEIWLELLKAQFGYLNEKEMLKMQISEVSSMLMGLPVQSELIRSLSLRDITEPSRLSDADFDKYVDYLRERVRTLQNILTGEYEYSFTSNNMRYYWIPIEDFP